MKYINIRRKAVYLTCMAGIAALIWTGCGKSAESGKIAMITDGKSAEDGGINQEIWQGIQQYAAESGRQAEAYQPQQETLPSYEQTIDKAVSDGAEIIVCAGENFENAVYDMQRIERDVRFVLLDGIPENGGGDQHIRGNTSCVQPDRAEAGFLAGYAAVKEGYTSLGFLGGEENVFNIRYGSGYLQGANQAAADLGLEAGQVTVRYHFLESNSVSPDLLQEIRGWYEEGCQIVYACGSAPEALAQKAAESSGGKVISSASDGAASSSAVLTSTGTDYGQTAYRALKKIEEGKLPGGKVTVVGLVEECVALRMENAGFSVFSQTEYDLLIQRITDGEIRITEQDVTQDLNKYEINLISLNRNK